MSVANLDAALTAIGDAVNKLGVDLNKTLDDLIAKIAAGTDVSAEIATAQKIADSLSALDVKVVAADPTQPVVPPPPVAP